MIKSVTIATEHRNRRQGIGVPRRVGVPCLNPLTVLSRCIVVTMRYQCMIYNCVCMCVQMSPPPHTHILQLAVALPVSADPLK